MSDAKWDDRPAIRERLALLAAIGPERCKDDWQYNPSRDVWSLPLSHPSGPSWIKVRTEGSASLAIILERWGLDRSAAMAFIGYPETHEPDPRD